MTGFLASLAARSTGQERVLEPRRLPFEPHEELPLDAEAGAGAVLESAVEPQRPSAARPAARERTQAEPERRSTRRPSLEESRAEASLAPVPAPTAPDRPTDRAPALEEPVSKPDVRPEPRQRVAARARPRAPRRPTRLVESHPAWVDLADRVSPPRRRVLRSPPAAAPGLPADPETVRITIGRVDVRAVQAPEEKAPGRRASAPPRMTLDEYLARGRPR